MTDALYVHIPFCPHKCFYCDFNSYVVDQEDLIWHYISALGREMRQTGEQYQEHLLETIFIGGGTPSMLSPKQMERLFEEMQASFPHRSASIEITMEANPGTVDCEKLRVMRAAGVNRISFGAQTFQPELLKSIGRIHDGQDVTRSIELARAEGFENLSIDLMFGLPGQSMEDVRTSVEHALSYDLPHISLYGLKIEENTVFHHLYMRNELVLPEEEVELEMYKYIIEAMVKHGYEQYEISNFAKPGFASKHNTTYWKNRAYFGVGAGAHGYVQGIRHMNIRGVQAYIDACAQGLPRADSNSVSRQEAMEDFMMLGLRMLSGIERARFEEQFQETWDDRFSNHFHELMKVGLISPTDSGYRLTKEGLYLANEVFGRFIGLENL